MTTGSWPTNCVDTNLSAYFNKQDEISIEQGCALWGTRVIIPSRGRERVLELLHKSHPGIVVWVHVVNRRVFARSNKYTFKKESMTVQILFLEYVTYN